MGLSADDIEGVDFPLSRRGYDRAEVEHFRAKVAQRIRKLERKLDEARDNGDGADAAPHDDGAELTHHISEVLKLASEQAKRAIDEASAEADEIVAEARSEADAANERAEAARQVALEAADAIDAVRRRVAEMIEVELELHDELETAAARIRRGEEATGSDPDPLAQVVSEAVDRAMTSRG